MAHPLLLPCAAVAFLAGDSQTPEQLCVGGRASRVLSMVKTQDASMPPCVCFGSHHISMTEAGQNDTRPKGAAHGAAQHAQFLMRATFGPTRASMAELRSTTYEGWIRAQMTLPVESHRVYYRQRTNPRFMDYMTPLTAGGGGLSPRPKCAEGSRWEEHKGKVSKYTRTNLAFAELKPGVLLLKRNQGQRCSLERHDVIKIQGKYYRHSPRVELFENTPEQPMVGIQTLKSECPAWIDERRCRLLPPGHHCFAYCGSEGEVANDPSLGHHFGLNVSPHSPTHRADVEWDSNFMYKSPHAKTIVWVMKALHAKDQLRQRVAWALAQIFVAAPDPWADTVNEEWVHFYDIFVRNAFGNFRDVLGNVTFSPVMANYLTYAGTYCYDFQQHFADENYAREVMQLFTIGLKMLRRNGAPERDSRNRTVSTYGNEEITNYARVFTGFHLAKTRSNVEGGNHGNGKDPIVINNNALGHDVYPKPDLRGGWLGDGYPLCGDLPPWAYLSAGAVYEFRGYKRTYDMTTDIYEVPERSALFGALCRRKGGACTFALRVELAEALACFGGECRMPGLVTVKVNSGKVAGFYEYVRPACVHHFFYNGAHITRGQWVGDTKSHKEDVCANPDWPVAGASCCSSSGSCTNTPERKGMNCKNPRKLRCGSKFWKKHQVCALACMQKGQGYPGVNCSGGVYREQRICGHPMSSGVRLAEAQDLCRAQGLEVCGAKTRNSKDCQFNRVQYFVWTPKPCSTTLQVHWDGKVSGHTAFPKQNRFAVKWLNGAPAAGKYDVAVEASAVFTKAPGKKRFLKELPGLIGAFPVASDCAKQRCGRDGAVCFCGTLSQDTVMQFEGRFYKNLRSIVSVGGRKFRNPPVFRVHRLPQAKKILVTDAGAGGVRMSIAEVNAHLDQLFYHQNAAPFIAKLLIQRLVKSDPTQAYVQDVVDAFSSGRYAGKAYGGQYGDLGATVAAILLHPEALRQTGGSHEGALREPLLKVMHVMRAMEYKSKETYVSFGPLMRYLGEAPYQMPSVFNFYDPDYTPDRFRKGEYAPEFQIFNGPASVGLLNGLISLIEDGLQDEVSKHGKTLRIGLGHRYLHAQGALTFEPSNPKADATVHELDLLLTGERLTENTKRAVREAYARAAAGEKLKAAQAVIAMSPEFHAYGPVQPRGRVKRLKPSAYHPPRDYKAMVSIFLGGGADSWNFAVPLECNLYEEYKQIRQDLALKEPDKFVKVSTRGQRCKHFGIHAALPTIASLYQDGNAAVVSNIGSLVEPLKRETYFKGARVCDGLFSHKHMAAGVMTSVCQLPGATPKGVGGRMADALSSGSKRWNTKSFSIKGNSIFSLGKDTKMEVIDSEKGNVNFYYADKFQDVLNNITGQRLGNHFCEEYAQSVVEQVHAESELSASMNAAGAVTDVELGSDLAKQFHQIARLIGARDKRKAERDIFFVSMPGWDMHHDILDRLPKSLGTLDTAIKGFVKELKEMKVFDRVTMVTHSDFGRTLTSNGDGADHAWAGQQVVIGGSINGQRIYNDFPSTLLEQSSTHTNEYYIGRGRMIPKYPWESVMVPIAKWMGVEDPQLATVFPNLANFNSSHIISGARGAALFPGQ